MKKNISAEAQASDQMIRDCERAQAYTREYLDSMPEDGYEFKPTLEMRTFAEQMLRLASANFSIAAMASNTKSPYEGVVLEKWKTKQNQLPSKL